MLEDYSKKDDRIKVKYLSKNYMISGNTNEAIKMVTGDFIGLLDHDDLITEDALYEYVKHVRNNRQNECREKSGKASSSGEACCKYYKSPDLAHH